MDRYDIKNALERAVEDLANASAAQAWSTPLDSDPEGAIVVAEFGDWMAINGDLVFEKGKPGHPGGWGDLPNDQKIPKDYIETNQGGDIPETEEEVQIDFVIDRAADELGVSRDSKSISMAKILAVARELFGKKQMTYTSVSGESTHYTKRGKEKNPKTKIDPSDIDKFTRAYIEAALWSSNDESTPSGGEPLDANYSPADIAPPTLKRMIADCRKFQKENAKDIALYTPRTSEWSGDAQAGHDFWLTRNRHGAGAWDRDEDVLPKAAGERLTKAAHKFGEADLYVGDDQLIYQMGAER